MQQILKTLFEATPTLTPKLKSAARVILDNPNLVATTSMRALAARAGDDAMRSIADYYRKFCTISAQLRRYVGVVYVA